MKNTAGKTGRVDENVLYFLISYLFLLLRTVFIGAISGARATSNPLGKAWQARMDHLNLFLKEMNAPAELKDRTRTFLRNTRDLELKRSFNSLYGTFSKQLSAEMRSHMSFSIVRGVYYFSGLESNFLRDLASKLFYEAFERAERITHTIPTLSIVVNGTVVRGGRPFGIGQCFGEDAILASNALRDLRMISALTYCEICCVTKTDIHETAKAYPRAVKRLRLEALKIAMYRAPQMIAKYASKFNASRGESPAGARVSSGSNSSSSGVVEAGATKPKHPAKIIAAALSNLGEDTSDTHREVHSYFRAINGGKRLQGIASEMLKGSDHNVAAAAEAAMQIEGTPRESSGDTTLVDEDGNIVVQDEGASGDSTREKDRSADIEHLAAAQDQLASEMSELKSGLDTLTNEMRRAMKEQQRQLVALLAHQQTANGGSPIHPKASRQLPRRNGSRRALLTKDATPGSSPAATTTTPTATLPAATTPAAAAPAATAGPAATAPAAIAPAAPAATTPAATAPLENDTATPSPAPAPAPAATILGDLTA